MSGELAILDTNVLVYSRYADAEHHAACQAVLDQAQAGEVQLCVTSQILAEFFSIVTNPRRVSDPRDPQEALEVIERLLDMPGMTLLPMPAGIVRDWIALAREHAISRSEIFDV